MKITVELADDVATHPEPGREALEELVIAGYRTGVLSKFQARTLLALGRLAFEDLLSVRGIHDFAYNPESLAEDIETIERLRAEGKLAA